MRRLAAILALVLGLTLLAAAPVSAAVAAPAENRASGSAADPDNLIGIEARLSEDAVRENVALGYDIASDDAVSARGTTTVIGRTKDLGNLAKGERSLLDRLKGDLGSPQANWKRNSGVLREEMRRGQPIRDASPGDNGGVFLNAERNLLRDRGWTFDSNSGYWMPPVP